MEENEIQQNSSHPYFKTNEQSLVELGYREQKTRGLSVSKIRKNTRETILSVGNANNYDISWLQKQLDNKCGFNKNRQQSSKGSK